MCPGLPREANKYADRVGRVMNYGDGLYGGMFFAGMYAAAFFESDPRKVVEAGLRSIPAESGYAQDHPRRARLVGAHPADWKKTWQLVTDEWDKDDPCPDGALRALQHRREAQRRLRGARAPLRRRRLREDARRLHALRPGFRLQSFERARACWA